MKLAYFLLVKWNGVSVGRKNDWMLSPVVECPWWVSVLVSASAFVLLENGEKLFVYSERRFGKTSLVRCALDKLPRKQFACAYFSETGKVYPDRCREDESDEQ